MATPGKTVKDRFGDKKKLVDALKPFLGEDLWVGRENKDKGLGRISNAKLVRLFDTFSAVQSKWGTRAKLIDAILDAEGRGKDAGYKARIETWPVPRLYDKYKSASKKQGTGAAVKAQAPRGEKKPKGVVAKVVDAAIKAEKAVEKAVESAAGKAKAAAPAADKKPAAKKPAAKK
ncbi:MAG: hypothetical protein ABI175_20995 [Polyangiales bacterium]